MLAIKLLFWFNLFLLAYPYVIYPPLISLFGRCFPRQGNLDEYTNEWPSTTLIISAYNEEAVIAEKLENALSIDYPKGELRILVISDASDDETDAIVNQYAKKHVNIALLRQNERRGKTSGLNAGVGNLDSDIVVFSDANAMYRENSLKELIKYFRTENVGYVVGAALYNNDDASTANQSERTYWDMELSMKKAESDFYSVVGGDGAIYAIRRTLYENLDDDDINDFINPLQIISKNHIGLFNPKAICYEDTADDFEKEFKRKRRIVNRSWRAFKKSFSRFNIKTHSRFIFELISHKVIRWFSFLFILLTFFSSFFISIATQSTFYEIITAGILVCFAVVFVGRILNNAGRHLPKIVSIPFYFFFANYSALLGIIDNMKGVQHVTWNHVRGK